MLLSTAESSTYSASEVANRLHTDLRSGLQWPEAVSRTKIIGFNELNATDDDPTWKKYLHQFKNPLILLLLGKLIWFLFTPSEQLFGIPHLILLVFIFSPSGCYFRISTRFSFFSTV